MTEKIIDFIRFMENKVNPEQNIIEIDLAEWVFKC